MTDAARSSTAPRETLSRAWIRAVGLSSLAGAAIGALESARLAWQGTARHLDWAAGMIAVGVASSALAAALLAAVCAPIAWILWRRPDHRAAPPSSCAVLGAGLAVLSPLLVAGIGLRELLPVALGGTLLGLALRELLAWWPGIVRARTHAVLLALALAAGILGGWRAASSQSRAQGPAQARRPDVLLVTIDTLRADALGCYGNARARTPQLDALAAESILFEDATAQSNVTGPSHTTMLTGLYPAEHGALRNGFPIWNQVATLPELLERAGYRTGAFVSGFTLKNEACRLAPRFQRYDDELIAWTWMPEAAARLRLVRDLIRLCERRGRTVLRPDRPAAEVVDAALAWMREAPAERPSFTWVHCYDPHAPYEPPPPFDRLHDPDRAGAPVNWYRLTTEERRKLVADERELAHLRALYAGEVSYADAQVGRLLEHLRSSGTLEQTLVIVTSDHGEGLGEHGYYFDHGTFLYDDELHVPLLLRLPGRAPRRVSDQVRLLDLAPTLLDLLDLPAPANVSGTSLTALLDPESTPQERPSFSRGDYEGRLSGYELGGRKLALRTRGHKLIWTSDWWLDSIRVPERYEFYDLVRDPVEQQDLWPEGGDDTPLFEEMRQALDAWRELMDSGAVQAGEGAIDPLVQEQLRKLGY